MYKIYNEMGTYILKFLVFLLAINAFILGVCNVVLKNAWDTRLNKEYSKDLLLNIRGILVICYISPLFVSYFSSELHFLKGSILNNILGFLCSCSLLQLFENLLLNTMSFRNIIVVIAFTVIGIIIMQLSCYWNIFQILHFYLFLIFTLFNQFLFYFMILIIFPVLGLYLIYSYFYLLLCLIFFFVYNICQINLEIL